MTIKICTICGLEISDDSTKCPRCGYSDRTLKKTIIKSLRKHPLIYLVILLIIFATGVRVASDLIKKWENDKKTDTQYQALQAAVANQDWPSARKHLVYFRQNYLIAFKDVKDLEKKIRIVNLKESLKSVPTSNVGDRLKILNELVSLDPLNKDLITWRDAARLELGWSTRLELERANEEKRVREIARRADLQRKHDNDGWYITQYGYIAAISELYLDRAVSFTAQGDSEAFGKYIKENYPFIFILKGGDEVYLEEIKMWKGYAKIRLKGSTSSIWTQYKALKPK